MPRSKSEFRQQASISQKLAHQDNIYQMLAGIDREISDNIGIFLVLGEFEMIDLNDTNWRLVLALLDVLRKSAFATSDKVNEITKMGMQMPKGISEVDYDDEP